MPERQAKDVLMSDSKAPGVASLDGSPAQPASGLQEWKPRWAPTSRGGKYFSSERFGDVSKESPLRGRANGGGNGAGPRYTSAEEVLQREIRTSVANPLQHRISAMAIEDTVKEELRKSVADQVKRQIDIAVIGDSVEAGVGDAVKDLKQKLQTLTTIQDGAGNQMHVLDMFGDLLRDLKALHAAVLSPSPCTASKEDGSPCPFPADRPANWTTTPVNRCADHAHLEYDHGDPKAHGEVQFWNANGEGLYLDVEEFVDNYHMDAKRTAARVEEESPE